MKLFRRMLVEEFRMHTELFGPRRFLAFPVMAMVMVAGGTWLLGQTGLSFDMVVGGIHLLVFFFGLQVGTAGLVGRDAMRDVLGEVTLLVFSARTLPVSRQSLLTTFLVKDLVYYMCFFLTPLTLGFIPFVAVGELPALQLGLLWVTVTGTFALGAATSLTLAGIATRSRIAITVVFLGLVAGLVFRTGDLVALTPYGTYVEQTASRIVSGFVPLACLLVVGPIAFEPAEGSRSVRRIETDRFQQLSWFGDGLTVRPLLEVSRSSGSVWKVAFSLGILFAVTGLLLDRVVAATNIDPSAGIAFGTLLGLGTFTTYNWVTQPDNPREYLRYPRQMEAVFAGKRRAFFLLSVPTGLGYLALAGIWYPLADLLVGVVVFPLVSIYVFAVTAYITGLSPNELLFDTVRFGAYGIALAIVAVPLLVASLAHGTYPTRSTGIALGLAVVAALVGAALARRTGRHWHHRLRTQE